MQMVMFIRVIGLMANQKEMVYLWKHPGITNYMMVNGITVKNMDMVHKHHQINGDMLANFRMVTEVDMDK